MRCTAILAGTAWVALATGSPAWGRTNWADPNCYGTPTNLGALVNTTGAENTPTVSADELTLIFTACVPTGWGPVRPGCGDNGELYITTRASKTDSWGKPVLMSSAINTSMNEETPALSVDGLELYFLRKDLYAGATFNLWATIRASTNDPWPPAEPLPSWLNISGDSGMPCLSADGLTLYYSNWDYIFVTTRSTRTSPWGPPTILGPEINMSPGSFMPCISWDGLSLLFSRHQRYQGSTYVDAWVSTRDTLSSPWKQAIQLPEPVNMLVPWEEQVYGHGSTWLSADQKTLYFVSSRPGGFGGTDLWQVPIFLRPADFDGDSDVDQDDLEMLVMCTTGPAVPYDPAHLPPGCTLAQDSEGFIPADLDRDGDVDADDFGRLQRCSSGADIPTEPACAS